MNNHVKRALVTSNTILTDTDGKSLRVLSIAELLSKTGFEVTLAVSQCQSTKAKSFSVLENKSKSRNTLKDSFMKKVFHFSRQFIVLISFYAKLLVNSDKYDLIVSTLVGPEIDSFLASMLSKLKRIPFVYDYDDPSPEIRILFYKRGKNDPRVKLSKFSRNLMVKSANIVLTSANSTKIQLQRYSKASTTVTVFYNLPKLNELCVGGTKKSLRKKLNLDENTFVISYLGNLPNWSIDEVKKKLLCCAENLGKTDFLFLIIGGGPWEESYRQLFEEHKLESHLLITGRQPRTVALEYFVASDISLIPFALNCVTSNIVPTKLFEAMALGVPVLCSRSPNYVEIVGDDAIYFDGSCRDLTEKIKNCLSASEKLMMMSSNLKSKFLSNYTVENIYPNLEKILNNVYCRYN
jgi:glycosyltransferase involved in cell wall biosynthesis